LGDLGLADLGSLQQTLGITFTDLSLLEQALVHGSYINENPELASISNERLEFLGDAVLGLVIAGKLYQDFSSLTEGDMTKLRAAVVCRDALARTARTVRLGGYLCLGRGEESSGGRRKPTNLARATEAVIAAVYLDQGLDAARDFILRLFEAELKRVISQDGETDYKSRLQEIIQARHQLTPTYHLVGEIGPGHDKQFTVEVKVGDTVLGSGKGKSKRLAEAEAARSALERF